MGRNCRWCRLYELLTCCHIYQQQLVLLLVVLVVSVVHIGSAAAAAQSHHLTDHQLDQLYRQQQLTRLKQRILEGLGLTKIPDVSKMNVSREEYERMYRVYLQSVEQQQRREQQEASQHHPRSRSRFSPASRTTRPQHFYSFPHAPSSASSEARSERMRRKPGTTWLYFPVQTSEREAEVSSASLRLQLITRSAPHTLTLRVYQLLRADDDPAARGEPERLLIDQREVHVEVSGSRWTELDVSRAVQTWLRDQTSNLGLELQCRGCVPANAYLDTEERAASSPLGPVLNVLTTEARGELSGRGRRSIDFGAPLLRRTNCSSSGERCCRHSMEVVFKELEDFDFILQPTKYDAGYCKGRCPPRYNPASHHALLQSLVWKRDRSLAPRPCCAPSKLKSLQMLVLDADDPTKLRVVSWTEMEVEECACT